MSAVDAADLAANHKSGIHLRAQEAADRLRSLTPEPHPRRVAWEAFAAGLTIDGEPYTANENGYAIAMAAFYSGWQQSRLAENHS